MKNLIYTAIFDDYDKLRDPLFVDKNCSYICFTDNENLKSYVWQIVQVKLNENYSKAQSARNIKINIHKYVDKVSNFLWIDANQQITRDLSYIFDKNDSFDITLLQHPDRICIYEEALACIQLYKDSQEVINAQMKRYFDEGYPEKDGLHATGLIIRKNNERINKFCEAWFNEILHGSHRDQLSFDYVNWKKRFMITVHTIPFDVLKQIAIRWKHEKK